MIRSVDDSVDNSALKLDNVKWCSFVCDYDFDPSKIDEVGDGHAVKCIEASSSSRINSNF